MRREGVGREQLEFVQFYETSRDACLRAVIAGGPDRQLAEDLVAEAFARAWRSWREVSRHPAPRAWVVRTALNARVSWWRKRRREVPLADHDRIAPGELGVGMGTTTVTALRRLPVRQREVIVLRLLLDLDTETTARALGIAPGTVMSHLSRAVAALRFDLAPPNADATTMETSQ